MTTSPFIKKLMPLVTLAAIFTLSGFIVFQLQTAFGWTNPVSAPPGGSGAIMADPNTGNVGIKSPAAPDTLTVNGTINALGHLVKGVATPVAGTDAVNKDYLLAQTGGSLTGPLIFYGVGTRANSPIPPDPGTSAPACPNGYSDLLYSPSWDLNTGTQTGPLVPGGYGPLGVATGEGFGAYVGMNPFDEDEGSIPQGAVTTAIGTYSICSGSSGAVIPSLMSISQISQSLYASACQTSTYGGPKNVYCNTCRICGKDIPLVSP